jgi:hypothetical protein
MTIRFPLPLVIAAASACGGNPLAGHYVANDGVVISANAVTNGRSEAALASAAHDIPCARGSVADISHDDFSGFHDLYVVEGCGQRVTYKVDCEGPPEARCNYDSGRGRFLLLSRMPLSGAVQSPP